MLEDIGDVDTKSTFLALWRWLLLACLHKTYLPSAAGPVKAATALLPPDMLADHEWSYAPCGGAASLG